MAAEKTTIRIDSGERVEAQARGCKLNCVSKE